MRSIARFSIVTVALILVAGAATAAAPQSGARYLLINKDIQMFTTRYPDLEVTTARRGDGAVVTQLRSYDGRFTSEPRISRPETMLLVPVSKDASDAARKTIEINTNAIEVDAKPLVTVNAEAYRSSSRTLRPLVARKLIGDEPESSEETIMGIRAATTDLEVFVNRVEPAARGGKERPLFRAFLREIGTKQVLGQLAWYAKARVGFFQTKWQPRALAISTQDLGFEPDMAWTAIQLLSFARSAQAVAGGATRAASVGALNEVGCDSPLHWLDNGILRPCCDDHDRCFETYGCNAGMAWLFRDGWSCSVCTINVVACFGLRYWLIELGYLDGEIITVVDWFNTPMCYLEMPGVCPVNCFGCVWDFMRPQI